MSLTTWTPHAVHSNAFDWQSLVWRMVESQHIASTMKLVDTREEQDLLESLLESSKPSLPTELVDFNYLLATPFRYPTKPGGSRFRGEKDPGVFYGAESIETAGAELAYWRWKFLQEAEELTQLEPIAHSVFKVKIATTVVDLQRSPFNKDERLWQHPNDYLPTQQFARIAREANIGGILYQSVRNPQPSWCMALLTASGFAWRTPQIEKKTWYLAVAQNQVILRCDNRSIQFSTAHWMI